ncbi:MAG TPA: Gfo/Idh/MocA family oxidoreductase [Planctomycetes bacterium]|nr:Gfo/Idh/MocA family oxidoreductase [Planctomycetota bacterium]
MASKIKVGLITHAGGPHVGAYLQALSSAEQCDEVALADPDRRWENQARQVLGNKLKHVERDYKAVLRVHRPQMALVTMEAQLAPPVIDHALDADCHVFAEKPACVRVEGFAPLANKADSKHRHLMLALANRTNPEIVAARAIMQSGRIGKLYGVEMHLIADQTRLTRQAYHEQWFAQKDRAGGGHLIWLGIHWLDLAMHITGDSIVETAGFTTNIGGQPIDIEDSAAAAFRFENGALGTVTSGYYLDKSYHSHIKVWGSEGWLHIEPMEERPLTWYSTKGEKAGAIQTWDGAKEPRGYTPFVHEAIRACAEMTDPPISNADSLRALKTVFAIYSAAASRRATKIE